MLDLLDFVSNYVISVRRIAMLWWTRSTQRRVPYRLRQIYRNGLMIIWILGNKNVITSGRPIESRLTFFCARLTVSEILEFQSLALKSRPLSWGTALVMVSSVDKYQNRAVHFCARSHCFRDINFSNAWSSKVDHGHDVQFYNVVLRWHFISKSS